MKFSTTPPNLVLNDTEIELKQEVDTIRKSLSPHLYSGESIKGKNIVSRILKARLTTILHRFAVAEFIKEGEYRAQVMDNYRHIQVTKSKKYSEAIIQEIEVRTNKKKTELIACHLSEFETNMFQVLDSAAARIEEAHDRAVKCTNEKFKERYLQHLEESIERIFEVTNTLIEEFRASVQGHGANSHSINLL